MPDYKIIKKLESYIKENPGQRAKLIAKGARLDKSLISRALHSSDKFSQDENYGWHIISKKTDVLVLSSGWVHAISFEKSLNACGCLISSEAENVTVVFPEDCFLMLDAGARLLFLLNSLSLQNKQIELDFTNAKSTLHYLNRAGFIDALDKNISVQPKRPKKSTANLYRGGSDNLLELAKIDIDDYDESIPNELSNKFNALTNNIYGGAAYNAFSELCDNIIDHSESCLGGVAGLQKYKGRRPHVQIVISDAGKGIINTLRPALSSDTSLGFNINDLTDTELLVKTITDVGLSRHNDPDEGRGLGLSRGGSGLKEYGAVLSIRQENMYVKLKLKNNKIIVASEKINIPIVPGTHICMDFFID